MKKLLIQTKAAEAEAKKAKEAALKKVKAEREE